VAVFSEIGSRKHTGWPVVELVSQVLEGSRKNGSLVYEDKFEIQFKIQSLLKLLAESASNHGCREEEASASQCDVWELASIDASFNNITVTITDVKGETLCWASAGTCGFKGSRKSTPFAGQMAAQQAAEKAIKYGMKEIDVKVKGPGRWSRKCHHFPAELWAEHQNH
jgi:ribosomal protein S11